MTIEEVWSTIIEYEIATEETLRIITAINGYTIETLNDVLYVVTGTRTIEQFLEEAEEA